MNSKMLRFLMRARVIIDKTTLLTICFRVRIIHKNIIGRCEKKKKNWVDIFKRIISVKIKKSEEYKTTLI
jgi:hypothetical protein